MSAARHRPGDPVTPEEAAEARRESDAAGLTYALPPVDRERIRAEMAAARAAAAEAGDPAPMVPGKYHPDRCGCYTCGEWRRWKKRWLR